MSIRIQVQAAEIRHQEITTKKGQRMTLRKQVAYAFTTDRSGNPHPYPEKIELTLDRDQADAYPAGEYTLHPSSFWVGSFQGLECSPRLVPVKAR